MITATKLRKVVTLTNEKALAIATSINKAAPHYGLDEDIQVMRMFIAQTAHESGGYSIKAENMNYSAERIHQVWTNRFPTVKEAIPFAHNPILLANKAYGSRMGNIPGTNDGYNFRGSGYLQTTGREAVEAYEKYRKTGLSLEALAEKMRTDEYYAMDSAMWEFCVFKHLWAASKQGDVKMVTLYINGGYNGLSERQRYYKLATQYI